MEWEYLNVREQFSPCLDLPENQELSWHIVVSDNDILSIENGGPWRPLNQDEWKWLGLESASRHILGYLNNIPVFACEVSSNAENPPGYEFVSLWSFLGKVDEAVFYLIGKAKQIVNWHRNHQYCGQCGNRTDSSNLDRSRKCSQCDLLFYPRLSPSIIVLVTRGEELLLARNARARGSFYSTLAGFVEPGESIEDTVHREVFEETGIKVKNLKYFKSQSWPFPDSLMLGFHAEYESGEIAIQEEEIADAQWFHYKDLPNHPGMFSISGWLIDSYVKELQTRE